MNTINYRIKSMQVTSSCIDPKNILKKEKCKFTILFLFTMAVKECMLLCKHGLVLKKKENVFAEIILETIFLIAPDSVEGMKSDNKLVIPRGFWFNVVLLVMVH